ncbi:carboxymethylenebutenolidase [Rhodococcus sp. WMMA185]|uniref:dienelactone hydrolase family protein n=1 Tax=Rhodococcus sp. WMMA185 TaxID=679318 RepID=UPI00087800E1|nr:dienelactone hydrolase family protein [Rhodococcus sp. WMMA185]AOW93749.1 carboxymethylenebutenolidase [Rhodococcus sp. WMMA185]
MPGFFKDTAALRAVEGEPAGPQVDVPLTAIEPDGPARGGIVILHESRVFSKPLLDLMRSLALEGWVVVAPHLFFREPAHGEAEVFGESLFADFDATFDWLISRGVYPDCVGVLGFDDAGTAAMLVATTRRVGAAVSVAARGIVEPLSGEALPLVQAAPDLKAPWLGLYGDDDPSTPPEHVELLRAAAAKSDVAALLVSYAGLAHRADEPPQVPAGQEDDPIAEAIIDAQRRIFDWFDSHLR